MQRHLFVSLRAVGLVLGLAAHPCASALAGEPAPLLAPAQMPRVGTVDVRFQSYNIEMVEVTGGRFWRPYGAPPQRSATRSDLFAERAPIDLTNARLRRLAAALGPAYLRISGTAANATAPANANTASATPPQGFNGVLTRLQWHGAIDFARAVDARIATSFAISPGTRDAKGAWMPKQARRLLALTRAAGGRIAAAEFMNEPDLPEIGGAPAGYAPSAYGRDFKTFRAFMRRKAPRMLILGPGAIGQTAAVPALLSASGADLDVVSYHHYGALSRRCAGHHTPDDALSETWLAGADQALAFAQTLRDRFAPGKPIWLTETGEAACGGNPWAATFLDTFRYLDQLGRLAKAGVRVVMHNTLAASDYALLDEVTFTPRPSYWGALLWRRLMGPIVLDAGLPIQAGLHVYAHCRRDAVGVTLLVINTDRDAPHALTLAAASERYTLDAAGLRDSAVQLNGHSLALGAGDELPQLAGQPTAAGPVTFAPATITFLTVPTTNGACG
ncbi:hypothetical protein [Bradyrhizobium prioriisuperbiae]|uniref:hypothetical protein n=1 Tax=Bradyrhizobium prioriisuperbiae TaxID=2854389 RepID=UPI0028EFC057|nr:hypothetical protein [Bradyrhizobium prioritasuperba]